MKSGAVMFIGLLAAGCGSNAPSPTTAPTTTPVLKYDGAWIGRFDGTATASASGEQLSLSVQTGSINATFEYRFQCYLGGFMGHSVAVGDISDNVFSIKSTDAAGG